MVLLDGNREAFEHIHRTKCICKWRSKVGIEKSLQIIDKIWVFFCDKQKAIIVSVVTESSLKSD